MLGIVALLVIVVTIVIFRSGLLNVGGSEENLQKLTEKIKNHKSEMGSYPVSLETLIDPTDPIEKREIIDRWGNLYVYRVTETGFDLFSAGEDGRPGTVDDIRDR